MSRTVAGKCLCGASGFDAPAEVKFAIQCHCRDCQHISGGGSLPQIGVPSEGVAPRGKAKVYQTTSDAGSLVDVWFCGECGSLLYKSTSKMPDTVFLCAGSLEDDLVSAPFHRVFEECRRVWDG